MSNYLLVCAACGRRKHATEFPKSDRGAAAPRCRKCLHAGRAPSPRAEVAGRRDVQVPIPRKLPNRVKRSVPSPGSAGFAWQLDGDDPEPVPEPGPGSIRELIALFDAAWARIRPPEDTP